MKIIIQTIPHSQHRYPTVGDYWIDAEGVLQVRISKELRHDSQIAVILHELVELALVMHRGIDLHQIDEFDRQHEIARAAGEVNGEPGDAPGSPYRQEHRFAENVERLFIQELGIPWDEHEKDVDRLCP